VPRIRIILTTLDASDGPEGMDSPIFRLHPLKGDRRGHWAVTVRAFERNFRRAGIPQESLSADIDRYWHCVAAQIEAGLMDDDNELIPHDPDTGLAAYRDWRARHPDYKLPPFVRCASRRKRPLHDQ
jgi:hypothetical protein